MWWQHHGDLHLYEHLRTADNDMYGDLHGTCGTNGKPDLPKQYNSGGRSNAGSSKCSVFDLVGYGIR